MSLGLYARIAAAVAAPQLGTHETTVEYGDDPHQRYIVARRDEGTCDTPVVFFHGGGWYTGSAFQYRFVGRTLAHWGHTAVTAGYRLVPDAVFPSQFDDALEVVSRAVQLSESGRVVVGGFSAGAHLAALVAYDRESRLRAGIEDDAIAGVFSLAGILEFEESCADGSCEMVRRFMGRPRPWDVAEPIAFVTGSEPWPLIAIHGAHDELVVPASPRRFVDTVRGRGGQAELRIDDASGHQDMLEHFLGDGIEYTDELRTWLAARCSRES